MTTRDFTDARVAIINSSLTSSVYIGADSIRYRKNDMWYARYSTVIILHIDSNRGCQLFHESIEERDYGSLRNRLMREANMTIDAALQILDVLGDRKLEIHLDINPNPKYKSNSAVKEALGWVKGSTGVDAKIKPYSFAATHAADHVTRNPFGAYN